MQEIQEIQKLIKEQSDKGTLARFDVRDYEFRRVMKKKNRADIVQAYDSAPDIVARTAIGKTWAKERGTGYDYDYDASLFSNLIYQAAMFPEGEIRKNHGYEYLISYGGIDYRGDTMCSWSTTVNRCLRHNRPPRLDDIDETLATCIVDFMQVVYTIGNFIPAPSVFQKKGSCPSRDYWDLALAAIYNYYRSNDKVGKDTVCTFIRPEPYSLEWLLRGEKNAENCKPWLDRFKTWDNFVEQNFMQPFLKVDKPVNGHYGPPDELWKGHFDCGGIPQGEDEFQQFFTNATQRILVRGELIAKKVKETTTSAQ